VSGLELAIHGEPAIIAALRWDWWNVAFIAFVVLLLIGSFYFGAGEQKEGGSEAGQPYVSESKRAK